jgi:hypothetical protein
MDLIEAREALRYVSWDNLLNMDDGRKFAVILGGEPAIGTKVHSKDNEDEDNDRTLEVVVELRGQYFRNTGWSEIGSHCYGEYTPSWNGIEEVVPKVRPVTVYEPK